MARWLRLRLIATSVRFYRGALQGTNVRYEREAEVRFQGDLILMPEGL